ncbi:family 2 glycosyl transferase [Enterococcus termitis]
MSDEIKVIIDSIYREKQTNNLTVTGWALNTDTKTSPEISINNQGQVTAYTTQRVLREDVNQIYEADAAVLAGFELKLDGILKRISWRSVLFQLIRLLNTQNGST